MIVLFSTLHFILYLRQSLMWLQWMTADYTQHCCHYYSKLCKSGIVIYIMLHLPCSHCSNILHNHVVSNHIQHGMCTADAMFNYYTPTVKYSKCGLAGSQNDNVDCWWQSCDWPLHSTLQWEWVSLNCHLTSFGFHHQGKKWRMEGGNSEPQAIFRGTNLLTTSNDNIKTISQSTEACI